MATYKSEDRTEIARLQKGINVLEHVPPYLPAINLAKAVSEALLRVPGLYHGWADQLYRAAVSVPANIAEGHGRTSVAQRAQYAGNVALGSIMESVALLEAAPVGQDVTELLKQAKHVAELVTAHALELLEAKLSA